MQRGLNCAVLKYADDTKLYQRVCNAEDATGLQRDLDIVVKWCHDNNMLLNINKCSVMHFGLKNKRHTYEISGTAIPAVDTCSDLGVITSNTLSVSNQVDSVVSKANRFIGYIKRHIRYLDAATVRTLYNTYIRAITEFCIQSWRPWLMKDINRLERVQRRVTKLAPELKHLPYEERLKRLKLTSVSDRWTRGDSILVFKILNGFTDIDSSEFFVPDNNTCNTRGHNLKLTKSHVRLDVRKHDFGCRVVNTWNCLTPRTVNSTSVNIFKVNIDRDRS